MKQLLVSLLMLALAFAGCADQGDAIPVDDASFDDLELEVTDATGIIRGVVVDAAIQPVVGAIVTIQGTEMSSETNENGAFGFDNLEPGDYFLVAEKAGFVSAQQGVAVVAGVNEPPIVKFLLEADPENLPYFQELQFDGFIECSFSLIAVGFAACSTADTGNDVFIAYYDLDGAPTYAQGELVWDSTNIAGDRMLLAYSAQGDSTLLDNYAEGEGTSPIVVKANETAMADYGVGLGTQLMVRVFNAPIEGTRAPDPVEGDDCVDRPALGGCLTGLGATLNQEFTVFNHVFYNMEPPEGWQFSVDGTEDF